MQIFILLGIIQGIFEWIPISSEGIVALFSNYLVPEFNPIDIALFLHLGTLLAVIIYFRHEWKDIILLRNKRLLYFLLIATPLSLIIGYPLYQIVKSMVIGNTLLILMGVGLFITSYFHKTKKSFNISFHRLGVIAGLLQGLAVIPGLSRSGSTIFGLSLGKLNPSEILKISYIMSAPVIMASSVYLVIKNPALVSQAWISLIASFAAGLLSLHILLRLSKKINFFTFTFIFGILCFIGGIIGFIL